MWIPSSETDLKAALSNGIVRESSTFEAKQALPPAGKNKDLAKDICAMTPNGGVLVYGLGGNDPTRPNILAPFDRAGVIERVDQVIRTLIDEPPVVEILDFPSDDEPGLGYLVVVVPASSCAPHMLLADNRYWGRGAASNQILPEGEISRLYARREQWDINRASLLAEAIARFPFHYAEPRAQIGPMLVFARPVVEMTDLLRRAASEEDLTSFVRREISQRALGMDPFQIREPLGSKRPTT